jgi:hypothetical protein
MNLFNKDEKKVPYGSFLRKHDIFKKQDEISIERVKKRIHEDLGLTYFGYRNFRKRKHDGVINDQGQYMKPEDTNDVIQSLALYYITGREFNQLLNRVGQGDELSERILRKQDLQHAIKNGIMNYGNRVEKAYLHKLDNELRLDALRYYDQEDIDRAFNTKRKPLEVLLAEQPLREQRQREEHELDRIEREEEYEAGRQAREQA